MNIVLFEIDEIKKPLAIDDKRAKHILTILHKQVGDTFDAGIIDGKAGKATITSIDECEIHFTFAPESDGKPLYPLVMLIGFPRPIQLKRLFRDMASLGVEAIHLMGTELGEKSYMHSNIIEKGQARELLIDGAVQAKSTHVPKLFLHTSVKDCMRSLGFSAETVATVRDAQICLDNIDTEFRLKTFVQNCVGNNKVYAAIGSERGWSDNERELLEKVGFTRCKMGERILRTETAATVAASIILTTMDLI